MELGLAALVSLSKALEEVEVADLFFSSYATAHLAFALYSYLLRLEFTKYKKTGFITDKEIY